MLQHLKLVIIILTLHLLQFLLFCFYLFHLLFHPHHPHSNHHRLHNLHYFIQEGIQFPFQLATCADKANLTVILLLLLIWTSVIIEAVSNPSHRFLPKALVQITTKTMMIRRSFQRKSKTIIKPDCISSTKSRSTTIVLRRTQDHLHREAEEELQEEEISSRKDTDNQMCFRLQARWWYDDSQEGYNMCESGSMWMCVCEWVDE